MPEVSPDGRNRWYRVKWPDERQLKPAWAEKYFDSHAEAFDYFERRRTEHPTGRVHRPLQSQDKPTVWGSVWILPNGPRRVSADGHARSRDVKPRSAPAGFGSPAVP